MVTNFVKSYRIL